MSKGSKSEKQQGNGDLGIVMPSTPTVYLMDIDGEATVVIAENIADAMDKAERIAKVDYAMVYHKSLPLLY